jgi:hypothetical protein
MNPPPPVTEPTNGETYSQTIWRDRVTSNTRPDPPSGRRRGDSIRVDTNVLVRPDREPGRETGDVRRFESLMVKHAVARSVVATLARRRAATRAR